MRDRIYRIGIELEGGWSVLPPGTRLAHDGSVFRNGRPADLNGNPYALQIGELPSPPIPIKPSGLWEKWVRDFHPTHVDDTCGLHIHMSFRSPLHYQLLMVEEYTTAIINHLTQWGREQRLPDHHPLWPRLRGENTYCAPRFYADAQARARSKSFSHGSGDRYTFINYCYGLHSTLECRGLPMFPNADLSISALQNVMDTTNKFLISRAKREPKQRVNVVIPDERSTEYLSTHIGEE